MAKNYKFTCGQVAEALKKSHGLVSLAARALKCSPKTVRRYIKDHPSVAAAQAEAKTSMMDMAEGKLYNAVLEGKAWAIKYYLTTQGAERGYNLQLVIAKALLALRGDEDQAGMDAFMDSMEALIKSNKKK